MIVQVDNHGHRGIMVSRDPGVVARQLPYTLKGQRVDRAALSLFQNVDNRGCWVEYGRMARPAIHKMQYRGVVRTLAEWARRIGVPVQTLYYRRRLGWSPARILQPPRLIRKIKRVVR